MNRKRKKHSEEMKARVALEALKRVRTLSELSAAYGVHPTVIAQWKRQLVRGASAYPFPACANRQPFGFGLRKGTPTYLLFPTFWL